MVHADGTVVFGCQDDFVRALNATTGTLAWEFQTDGPVVGSPAVSGDGRTVYIGGTDAKLYAIRLRIRAGEGGLSQSSSSNSSSSNSSSGGGGSDGRLNSSPSPSRLPTATSPSSFLLLAPSSSSSSSLSSYVSSMRPTKTSDSAPAPQRSPLSTGENENGEVGVASEADGQDQDVTTIIAAITGGCGGILSCAAVIYVLKLTRRKRVDEKRQEGVSDRRNSGDWFRMSASACGSETVPTDVEAIELSSLPHALAYSSGVES